MNDDPAVRSDPATTDGWRGMPGAQWSEMSILPLVAGLADEGALGGRAAVGYDGRAGSRELAVLTCDLLAERGVPCVLGTEVTLTPALGRFVHDHPDIGSGLMFTASHNPPGFAGMKFRDGEGLSAEARVPRTGPVPIPGRRQHPDEAPLTEHYMSAVGHTLTESVASFGGEVVIDAAHGAAGILASRITTAGWCRARPLPFLAGQTPDPVIRGNVEREFAGIIARAPRSERVLAAFVDGDGDRLVLATAKSGFISSAEQAGILCLAGTPASLVIATNVTPRMVQDSARAGHSGWAETQVGFKHIVAAWRRHGRPAALGVEPNGAVAYAEGRHAYFERDALCTLRLLVDRLPSVTAIDDTVTGLRRRYPYVPQTLSSTLSLGTVTQRLAGILVGWEISRGRDVVTFSRGGWRFMVRASGTEALTRVYAEAPDGVIDQVRRHVAP